MKTCKKWFGRLTAWCLTVLVLADLCVPLVHAVGTKQEVHIATVSDWEQLVNNCRLDAWSDGVTVILENDLTLPKGSSIPTFGGTFEGGGHTLSRLELTGEGDHQGLFRYIRPGAVVQNLTVSGAVTPSGSSSMVGGIVGSNSGTLKNCSFLGAVSGKGTVGGLVGVNEVEGRIEDCVFQSGAVSGEHYTGGVVGENRGTILRCDNRGQINTQAVEPVPQLENIDWKKLNQTENVPSCTDTGGIAGYSSGLLQSCTNFGLVGYPHLGYNVGGIAGRQVGQMVDCSNSGAIRGRKDVGGIVGQAEPFTQLRYEEDTLQRLGRELNTLSSILNHVVDETSDSRRVLSDHLTSINDLTGDAQTHTSDILHEIGEQTDGTVDTINELSERIAGALDDAHPIGQHISQAFDNLETAAEEARRAVSGLQPNAMVDAFAQALSGLQTAMDRYKEAKRALLLYPEDPELQHDLFLAKRGMIEAMQPIHNQLDRLQSEVGAPVKGSLTELAASSREFEQAFAELTELIQHQSELPVLELPKISAELREAENLLGDTLNDLRTQLDAMNESTGNAGDTLNDGLHRINNQFSTIAKVLRDATKDEDTPDKLVVDISQEDLNETAGGRLQDCRNMGPIEGDVNVGGVVGAMAIEFDFDPEDDAQKEGTKSLRFQYLTKAVTHSCVNRGPVKARKDSVGGIVGRMDLGIVWGGQNYGAVESTSGQQVGGIAGYSEGVIQKSWAKCDLTGTSQVGGITGSGMDIKNCRAMVELHGEGAYQGAIAGNAAGSVVGNLFLSETLGGIDGISYQGKAAPMGQADFFALSDLPVEFSTLRVRFTADGALVKAVTVPYGSEIPVEEIPAVPAQTGYYGEWSGLDKAPIVFDREIPAVYTPWLTAVANEDGTILAEGQFQPKTSLQTTSVDADLSEAPELLGAWSIALPQGESPFTALRIKLPEGSHRVSMWVMGDNGLWKELATTTEGSYLRAEWEATTATVCLVENGMDPAMILVVLLVVALVLCLIFWHKKKHSKKNQKKK